MARNSRKFNKTASREDKRKASGARMRRGKVQMDSAKRQIDAIAKSASLTYRNAKAPDLPKNRDLEAARQRSNSQSASIQRMRASERAEAGRKRTAREAITPQGRGKSLLSVKKPADGLTREQRIAKRKSDVAAKREALSKEYSGGNRIIASNTGRPINPVGPAYDWRQIRRGGGSTGRKAGENLASLGDKAKTSEDKAEDLRRRRATRRGRPTD